MKIASLAYANKAYQNFSAVYSHKANTFVRIFFINLRIPCQKILAALVYNRRERVSRVYNRGERERVSYSVYSSANTLQIIKPRCIAIMLDLALAITRKDSVSCCCFLNSVIPLIPIWL